MATEVRRAFMEWAREKLLAHGAVRCDECDGFNPNCSNCGGSGVLYSEDDSDE